MSINSTEKKDDFTAVGGPDHFDLLFYRKIGLDLSRLEDDDREAPMPLLRRSASHVIEAVNDAHAASGLKGRTVRLLDRVHETVQTIMHDVVNGIDYSALSPVHPEVLAWQERNEQLEKPDPRSVLYQLKMVDCIHLGIVRPRMEDIDPSWSNAPYSPVKRPEGVAPGVEGIADQLVLARPGIWFDI